MTALHVSLAVVGTALPVLGILHAVAGGPSPLLINESPSVPRGIYVRTTHEVAVGRLVVLTPPAQAKVYLGRLGAPPGAQLLKRVAATGGEPACARKGRLVWPRGAVATLPRDRAGRDLPRWRGCRRLAADELLVVGDTAASFDSRYFGPIRRADVRAVYREAWRW